MPSVRSIILLAVLIVLLSVTIGALSMLQPPDSGGMGGDTYGTRAHGFRALFEILSELDVPVRRRLRPPAAAMPTGSTLVFLAPHPNLVGVEPAYLQALHDWVRLGGRIVVAPPHVGLDSHEDHLAGGELRGVLEVLDLPGVRTNVLNLGAADNTSGRAGTSRRSADLRDIPDAILGAWTKQATPIETVEVEPTGSLAELQGTVDRLAVPGASLATIAFSSEEPSGTVRYTGEDDAEHHLVAQFRRGEGEIIVVGDPHLLTNRFIARAKNSVLAAHLLAPAGQTVVFDEFYHGLSVRGNPLYLLTRPGYATVVIAVLLLIAAWTWREAVFLGPPLPDVRTPRRDVREYVDAMSRFFHRGKKTRPFLLREVRDGVLNQLCQQVGLPPEVHDKDAIIAAIARREPDRAKRIEQALAEVDDHLAHSQHWSESKTYHAMQRITACL